MAVVDTVVQWHLVLAIIVNDIVDQDLDHQEIVIAMDVVGII